MIAKILPIFVLLAVSHQGKANGENDNPLIGVDPNTLSCDPRGEISLLLPHYTNCSKFFMCAHGREVEFSCAPGNLHFDFELQTCNHAWASRCWLRIRPEDEVEGSGEDEFDLLSNKADVKTGVARSSVVVEPLLDGSAKTGFNTFLNCLRADTASQLVPYKGDCQRYWRCANGVPQSAYCTDGLYFNENKQQCDFEANVKCQFDQDDELKTEFIAYK